MLAAIIWIYTQAHTFDYWTIRNLIAAGHIASFSGPGYSGCSSASSSLCREVPLFPSHMAAGRTR